MGTLLVLSAGAGAKSAAGAKATADSWATAVTVDPLLVKQLERNGRAAAVVTVRHRQALRAVNRLGIRGTSLRTLPMILTKALTRAQLAKLRRSPFVRSVWANTEYRLAMEDSTWITRARYAWEKSNSNNGLPGLDTTGKGIHIAVIDTGADAAHDDLENVVEYCDATPITAVNPTRTGIHCTPWIPATGNQPYLSGTNPHVDCAVVTCDDEGHGTHVSGTIAGSGSASGGRAHPHSTIGIAPDAKLHVYSANVGGSLFNFQVLAAYDDLIYKRSRGIYPTVAVSNSWGGGTGYDPGSPQSIAFKEAYFVGILSVFAAGNSGPEHNTSSAQCNNPFVVCVAATAKPDHIAMFSSRGRPSEPWDVNRDGVVAGNEGSPDNHDLKLGRAFDVGVYRPRVAAPGMNINAASANSPQCRETGAVGTPESAVARACYEPLSGTSMATPHVSGVVALIAEAYHKGHDNKLPRPQIITEILERSSNEMHKLPGWDSEEQGTGRIDAYRAVELAKNYPFGMKEPVLGTPTARYEGNRHPGPPSVATTMKGCTGTLSWSAPEVPLPNDTDPTPVATERYGQHFIVVPTQAERLRITIRWRQEHQGANLYARLWRPGILPDTADSRALDPASHQKRSMADNEATGLTGPGAENAILNRVRLIEARAPEETIGNAPAQGDEIEFPVGVWTLRVYHRAGGAPRNCDADSQENPKQTEGFNYTVSVEIPRSQTAPTARITEPQDGSTIDDRWARLGANGSYPDQWEGVTNWEVPGTETPVSIPDPDNRKILYFHGNNHVAEASAPDEAGCSGSPGNVDVATTRCPILLESSTLSPDAAAFFEVPSPLLNGGAARNVHDPNWTWYLQQPTSVYGPMTVEWWASCPACDEDLGLSADWNIRVWADGVLKFQRRVTATPDSPLVPERLEATVSLPLITANSTLTLHVDPVFIDTQNDTKIYYDSTQACLPLLNPTAPCDSLVRMPVVEQGEPTAGDPPTQVRVTDLQKSLRVAWNPAAGAQRYEIHRSTDPAFIPSRRTRIAITEGYPCNAPNNPTWPSYNRPGLCYDDAGGYIERTYYFRVVALRDGVPSNASLLSYGQRTKNDRQTLFKVDRLYGPQYWEHASVDATSESSWHYWWDTLQLLPGPHEVWTRTATQGIPSPKDKRTYVDSGADR
jgi:subtilisin family serine protease